MPKLHVAVVGAGAFGGWTALYLLRRGARVSLVDAWGPGNSRSSSGDETPPIAPHVLPYFDLLVAQLLVVFIAADKLE